MKKTSICVAVSSLLLAFNSYAQIVIGQSAGFTGTVADGVKDITYGATLYFDSVNAKGGVNGQKIELLSMDDKFDAKLTAEQARILIEEKNVSALFLTRGTPQTEAVLPLLEKHGVALVAPSTGAINLRQPVLKYVFNVRPTYQHEAEKIISHFSSAGLSRFAVLYADDSFGADAVNGAKRGLEKAKITPVVMEKLPKTNPDFPALSKKITEAKAQVVVMIASGKVAVEAIRTIKATGYTSQFVALSNNATAGFAKSVDTGVVVSQVFPMASPMVKELTTLSKMKQPDLVISPAMLEGYASAKVMVEGLRRAGVKPSREKVRSALEAIDKYDVGGFVVSYSAGDHSGFEFSELSVVSNGKFRR